MSENERRSGGDRRWQDRRIGGELAYHGPERRKGGSRRSTIAQRERRA